MSTTSSVDVVLPAPATAPAPAPDPTPETGVQEVVPAPAPSGPEGDGGEQQEASEQQQQQQQPQQPRKKKITRLIPAEESLAVIEECTEHSEDSSVVSEGGLGRDGILGMSPSSALSPPSKVSTFLTNLPDVLGEKSLSESSLHSLEAKEEAAASAAAAAALTTALAEETAVKDGINGKQLKNPGVESSLDNDNNNIVVANPADELSDQNSEQPTKLSISTIPLPVNGVASAPLPSSDNSTQHQDSHGPSHLIHQQQQSIPRDPPPSTSLNHHYHDYEDNDNDDDARYPHMQEQVSDTAEDEDQEDDDINNNNGEDDDDETSNDQGGGGGGASSAAHSSSASGDEGGGGRGRGVARNPSGMFDFDDFKDELMDSLEDKEEILTWRLDPEESLSDWTIVVKSRDNPSNSETYHVHKNILAVGPRKSEYFVNVFRSSPRSGAVVDGNDPSMLSSSSLSSTTEVVLGEVAANAFPQLLDFMYSTDGDVEITSARACGLRHLAQYFGVRTLHKRVMDFIQKDLTMNTVVCYYNDVCALRDEKMLFSIAKFCSRNILKIDVSFPLLDVMDPFFFSKLLSAEFINTNEKRYHCSLLVADFCQRNRKRLDSKRFLMLTEESALPLVHHSVALTLLEIEADIVVAVATESLTEMTSLQKRCVKELSSHWRYLLEIESQILTRVCRKLPAFVVTDLLVKSLAKAKRKLHEAGDNNPDNSSRHSSSSNKDVDTASRHSNKSGRRDKHQDKLDQAEGKRKKESSSTRELRKEYEAKIEQMKQEHLEELARLKKEYETNLVRLRDILVDKDKTISRFWNEIKSFERLPNSHDGKLVASGRSHEASYVPEVRATPLDGYLFVAKKGGPHAKYPLFYYKKEERDRSDASSQTR